MNKIDEKIKFFLKDFNGEMLKELYKLKNSSIEYFYRKIGDENKVKFESMVKFSLAIDNLFR